MKKSKTYAVVLEERLYDDFKEAFLYHDDILLALSNNFRNRFEIAIEKIGKKPHNYFNLTKKLRRITLGKFPYLIVYRISNGEVTVIGLFHQSSKSSQWRHPKK